MLYNKVGNSTTSGRNLAQIYANAPDYTNPFATENTTDALQAMPLFSNSYVATLSQLTTFDPVAKVGKNTLPGEIVWKRISTGKYTATLKGAFVLGKTFLYIGSVGTDISDGYGAQITRMNDDTIQITTGFIGSSLADSVLGNTAVIIGTEN